MLTISATFKLDTDDSQRNIHVTPLFLQNHNQPWQPNEIYEISEGETNPQSLGKIVIDDRMNWHYEGEHELSETQVEQIARFVMTQI